MHAPPLSLYVHVPFCERKCHYCAFNSYAGRSGDEMEDYVLALLREWQNITVSRSIPLETIYVGGGTPSALPGPLLGRLLEGLSAGIVPGTVVEWTVEMNPGTATAEKLDHLLAAGVTRISMGVQSLDGDRLKKLGRIHTPDDVHRTVEDLRAKGFTNVNLDLIYGQPDQTLETWMADVDAIVALGPRHLSFYALQYEEGTVYTRAREAGRLQELEDDAILAMFEAALMRLAADGFEMYEISNFSLPGQESRHNQRYWRNEAYFGIGAGAYGCVGHQRLLNETDPRRYVERIQTEGSAVAERDFLGARETYVETLASGLRTTEGVDLEQLHARTGIDARVVHAQHLEEIATNGWGRREGNRLVLTLDGMWILDSVMDPFLDRLPERAPVATG